MRKREKERARERERERERGERKREREREYESVTSDCLKSLMCLDGMASRTPMRMTMVAVSGGPYLKGKP
jgi:hypothetical protein